MVNFNELTSTGNPAVDAVMTVVWWNRKKLLPIRAVYLSFRCYGLFEEFVKKQLGYVDTESILMFDGVEVYCNPAQMKDVVEDYYPMAMA